MESLSPAGSKVFKTVSKKNTCVIHGHWPNNGMSVSLLDALETCQGTNSSLFSQPFSEATSREGLENISSLVIDLGTGKLRRLLSGFARDVKVFSPTNSSFTLHNNRPLKIFFLKRVMPCNYYPFKSESN